MGCVISLKPPEPCCFSSAQLASGAEDRSVRIWQADTGECVNIFEGHGNAVCSVAALEGGYCIASGSKDCTVRIWHTKTGECRHILGGHKDWVVAVCALGGGLLASGSRDSTVRIWRTESGECLHVLEGHRSGIIAVAALGGDLVTGSRDYTLRIWRAETGKCLRTLEGHTDAVRAVVALGGGLIASGSEDNTVRIWRAETGSSSSECLRILEGHRGAVFSVAALRDGSVASGSGDNTIHLWSGETYRCIRTFEGHSDWVLAVCVCNDELVSASKDNSIRMWDPSSGECLRILRGHADWVFTVTNVAGGSLVDWDANAECQAAALLASPCLDFAAAAQLLQGRPNPRHGALAELEVMAMEEASARIQTCLAHLPESNFEIEVADFEAAHPELASWGGRPTAGGSAKAISEDWTAGPLGEAIAPLLFLASIQSDGDPCMAISPDAWASMRAAVRARLVWATQRGELRCLRYAVLLTKRLHWMLRCMDTHAFAEASEALRAAAGLPPGWRIAQMVRENLDDRLIARVEITSSGPVWKGMQALLDSSFVQRYTRDRRGDQMPLRLQLRRLFHVQNEMLWTTYQERRLSIREALEESGRDLSREPSLSDAKTATAAGCFPRLDDTCRERWLWHGTTHASVEAITLEHFKLNLAGSRAGTLYGKGIYLCECCSKSDEYTEEDANGERVLLLCRATLGRIFCTAEDRPDRQRLTEFMCQGGGYHSVLGDRERIRGTYREIILYDSAQVYPEYVVVYRRVMKENDK